MSGSESQANRSDSMTKPADINDVNEFAKSGLSSGLSLNLLTDPHTVPINSPKYHNQAEYDKVIAAFKNWKDQEGKSGVDYKAYLDAVSASPGRQGTILVPTTPTQPGDAPPPTLLTANKKKTVLG